MIKIATHDSGTGEKDLNFLHAIFSTFSKCQDKTIKEQWENDVRYFDLRISKTLHLAHGMWRSEKKLEDIVVVSPDHGGAVRAREFAKVLGTSIAIIDKRRPEPNKAEVMNIIGDIKGKTCIIVDDICDTAGTLTAAANALVANGAKEVYAACTHGLLSGPAVERIANSVIKEMIIIK